MSFEVLIAEEAEKDLIGIYEYILQKEGLSQAEEIENRLLEAILSLENLPSRGKCPPELRELGLADYRELQVHPWRIFYYVLQQTVGVVAILDNRRDLEELLRLRIL